MKSLVRLAVRLYPPSWRARYGVEFQALLDDCPPNLRTLVNVTSGAVKMQIRNPRAAIGWAALLGGVGLVVAACLAFATSRRVESTGTMVLEPSDPANQQAFDAELLRLATHTLEDPRLEAIFQRREVITTDHRDVAVQRRPVSASDQRWRGDVRLQVQKEAPTVLQVSFASDDPVKAREATQTLMRRMIDAALSLREAGGLLPGTLKIRDAAGEPYRAVSPQRVTLAGAVGLGAGMMLGLAFGVRRNRPRGDGV